MSGELVGPVPTIRYLDGTRQAYDVPRNTCDNRASACTDHHPACDCRESMLAEDIGEYRAMFREVEQAILAAIKGHQTYAFTGEDDLGVVSEDTFGQCKCPACVIARAAHIGFTECMQAQQEAWERLTAERAERARAHYARQFPGLSEVPF